MKKILSVLAVAAMFCSCHVMQSNVKVVNVKAPVLSATVASLSVEEKPITYTYTPSKTESKALSVSQLVENAQFLALQQHGSGDVLVNVSYKLDVKKFLAFRRVNSITITGYPASYTNFRNPTEEDRQNIDAFYNDNTIKIVAPTTNPILGRLKK